MGSLNTCQLPVFIHLQTTERPLWCFWGYNQCERLSETLTNMSQLEVYLSLSRDVKHYQILIPFLYKNTVPKDQKCIILEEVPGTKHSKIFWLSCFRSTLRRTPPQNGARESWVDAAYHLLLSLDMLQCLSGTITWRWYPWNKWDNAGKFLDNIFNKKGASDSVGVYCLLTSASNSWWVSILPKLKPKGLIEWLNCCMLTWICSLISVMKQNQSTTCRKTQFLSSRGINTHLPRGSGKEFQRLVEWLPALVSIEETAKSSDYRIWDSLKFHKVVCILLYPLIILILLPRIDVGFEVAWNVCKFAHIFNHSSQKI